MIELEDVHKTLGGKEILKGMTLSVPEGENYVIMGPSGIGKSVMLKHVIGILRPDRGRVLVDGRDVGVMDRDELMTLRKRMGYLFQNGALINWLTVGDNVALPLDEHTRLPRATVHERVMEVLDLVGMAGDADKYPSRLSGGMRLRAGLARALVTEPEYVLYDEPNAGLDPLMSEQICELIVKVRDEFGVTGLVVTHSRACACTVGDRIGVIEDGRILEEGTVPEMMRSDTELVRHFLSGLAD